MEEVEAWSLCFVFFLLFFGSACSIDTVGILFVLCSFSSRLFESGRAHRAMIPVGDVLPSP